ncbi:MAG: MraY family glycosyltransferase [Wenzhouxiangella sp.]
MSTALATSAAFLIAALMVPVLQSPARRIGLVDQPCKRKRHDGSVPLTGGLAMFIAITATFGLKLGNLIDYTSLVVGMAALLVMGLIDDLIDLRAMVRLLVQISVASMTVLVAGVEVNVLGALFGPALGPFGLGPFSALFTIVSIVFLINVINMSDGVDGLAGGITLLFFAMLALVAWLSGAPSSLWTVCLVMAAATAGFLVWNMRFPFRGSARAFMGDAGSMMLGFAAAWLAITVATAPQTLERVYPILIVWILLVPSMDTIAVVLRRMSQGRSPMAPDRAHLHHILRRMGLSVTATVSIIHLSVLSTGLAGILAWRAGVPEWLMFAVAAALIIGYTIALINAHRILRWGLRRRSRALYNKPTIARVGKK